MKRCSKCGLDKPLDAFSRRAKGDRGLYRSHCRACVAMRDAARIASGVMAASAKSKRLEDPVRHREYQREYYRRYREKIRAKKRAEYLSNRDGNLARSRRWRKQNAARHCEYVMRRDAMKLRATPKWADLEKVMRFYEEARKLSALTGVKHHVDHIYPMRGKNVCGLHNEFNLRVVTAHENQRKYNLMPEEYTRRAEMGMR